MTQDVEATEAPVDELTAAAEKALDGVSGQSEPEETEQPEASAEGASDEPVEEVSAQDKYLRKHIPQAALKKMTLAERFEAYHELREREFRTLAGQKGRERKADSPSEEPDAPRDNSTAARAPFSDAALSEAFSDVDRFSKENALDGLTPTLSKPFKAVVDYANGLGQDLVALRKENAAMGQALQSLLRDRALEGIRAEFGAPEGRVREEFEKEFARQLKSEDPGSGLDGMSQAARRAARNVMGSPAASPSASTKTQAKRKAQPTAPTGRTTTEKKSSFDDMIISIVDKHGLG